MTLCVLVGTWTFYPDPIGKLENVQHYFPKLQKKRPESRNDQSKQGPFHRQACPQWNVWKI